VPFAVKSLHADIFLLLFFAQHLARFAVKPAYFLLLLFAVKLASPTKSLLVC